MLSVLAGGRLNPGEIVMNLGRIIQAFPETDVTTVSTYRIEQQRNPHHTFDMEKATLDALMVDLFPDAAFPVSVIMKNGREFIRDMSFKASGVVYAFEHPDDPSLTVMQYEEDNASPLITYVIDMPLISGPGEGGTVGFLNLFNSDSDGTPASTPTSAPAPAPPTTPSPL